MIRCLLFLLLPTVCYAVEFPSFEILQRPDILQLSQQEIDAALRGKTEADDVKKNAYQQLKEQNKIPADSQIASVNEGGYVAHKYTLPLFYKLGYYYTGGDNYENTVIQFVLRVPPSYEKNHHTDEKYPLVIWFHGEGESGTDNGKQLAHLHYALNLLTGKDQKDFFLLATQVPDTINRMWTTNTQLNISIKARKVNVGDAPITICEEIAERVINDLPVDKQRISLFGACGGVFGLHQYLLDKPGTVAAAVYSSWLPPAAVISHADYIGGLLGTADNAVPVFDVAQRFYIGEKDSHLNSIYRNKTAKEVLTDYVAQLKKAGCDAEFVICKEVGDAHNSWRAALTTYNCLQWMLEQKRND